LIRSFSLTIQFYINPKILLFMCETLDEIHEAQLAAVIAKMRKERAKKDTVEIIAK